MSIFLDGTCKYSKNFEETILKDAFLRQDLNRKKYQKRKYVFAKTRPTGINKFTRTSKTDGKNPPAPFCPTEIKKQAQM